MRNSLHDTSKTIELFCHDMTQDIDWQHGTVSDLVWAGSQARLELHYLALLEFAAKKPFWHAEGLQALIDNIAHTAYHAGAIRQIILRLPDSV
jgi:hypothetical protein